MLTHIEKVIWAADFEVVTKAYLARKQAEAAEKPWTSLVEQGYQEVTPGSEALVTSDGREVLRAYGKAWALPLHVHEQRRLEALDAAAAERPPRSTKRNIHKNIPGESLTAVLCPICQAPMAKTPVCPNCAKGNAGFKILCICTVCSHEVYL